jgi:anthranilate synthase component 1
MNGLLPAMHARLLPSREDFRALAGRGNLIPVYREIIADMETPVSAFQKIDTGDHSFLFESVEKGGKFARYSFLGASPHLIFTARGKEITLREGNEQRAYTCEGDPLHELERLMAGFKPVAHDELPLFYGGAVGYIGFEAVTQFEPTVPRAKKDDLGVPDAYFFITDTLLIFDHQERRIKIVANAHVSDPAQADRAYDAAVAKIEELEARLERPARARLLPIMTEVVPLEPKVNMTREQYVAMTEAMQEYIRAGDIFQVVPSQRFEVPFDGAPLDLYRALRLVNPSPYMFCVKLGGMALVGASPELHVRCEKGKVQIRPIAGTRPRGETPEEDDRLCAELLADPKERAEHVMLVDLARNDVGRVCKFDTVRLTDFMITERYSHVMHIVSNVEGELNPGHTAYDVMRATFPAGTVSGSPKIRAMQIIADQEPTCRGTYAGAVGYFGFSGNLDSCIAIRTVLLKDGKAYLQAGGGLVADSTPLGEYNESVNKAKAGLKALAMAKQF